MHSLETVGNVRSDGRPILGISSRELLARLLEADDRAILVPAHIWTPWFSALGSKSGFDSIEECYGELASRIRAIETGLSSNPPMNWAVSSLDKYAIISNSDAHSPDKLGREATVLEMEPSFLGLSQALSGGGPLGDIVETIEFFPQEGKYHYDGHRACGIVLSPEQTQESGGICPVCGKPLTHGVLRRVCELADRPVEEFAPCPEPTERAGTNRRPYRSLIPLRELVAELVCMGPDAKKCMMIYDSLIEKGGGEFSILLDKTEAELEALGSGPVSGELLALAIKRMRSGRVSITPGYDGEFGVIRAFTPGERLEMKSQGRLFGGEEKNKADGEASAFAAPARSLRKPARAQKDALGDTRARRAALVPDEAQAAAILHGAGPALVIAGPGSGKTAVLAARLSRLLSESPAEILALTFTNKAAGELRARVEKSAGKKAEQRVTASTFHAFCLSILKDNYQAAGLPEGFSVLDETEREGLLARAVETARLQGADPKSLSAKGAGKYIEGRKRFALLPGDREPRLGPGAPNALLELARELGVPELDPDKEMAYRAYREELRATKALDFDDLVAGVLRLLSAKPAILRGYRERYGAIFVDEYQDINFAQYALIRLLAPDNESNLFAIGDPNQAIYGFRGADNRFITRFVQDYPAAKTYALYRSFRCAAPIVNAAGKLVGAGLSGVSPADSPAVSLFRREYPSDRAEAEGIARLIDEMIGGTRFFAMDSGVADNVKKKSRAGQTLKSLADCAILVRTSALAPVIGKALFDHGIPYVIVGERPWWESGDAKDALRALKAFAANPANAAALPANALRDICGQNLSEDQQRLIRLAEGYASIPDFLDSQALGSPQDGLGSRVERVCVMTIHAAKGLEFDHVFVAGVEEGLLPLTLFGELTEEELAEERRLLYVAMTRARKGLYISWARALSINGRFLESGPSRFLSDIERLVPLDAPEDFRKKSDQFDLFPGSGKK
jgi:uncharacterized protein (TIGR00375 family)